MLFMAVIAVWLAAEPGTDLITLLSRASGPVILAVIVFGAIKPNPWWVPGSQYRIVVQERREFLDLLMHAQRTTERMVTLAETETDERAPP